jgi:hypothetical protein
MVASYYLSGWFNEKTNYRARPPAYYDLFWETIKKASYSLPWLLRHNPESPCSLRDFRLHIPPARIHNFLVRHKHRFAWDDCELCYRARRCKFLPGSKAKYPCHQRHICPFCQCEQCVAPLYKVVQISLQETTLAQPRLCRFTLFAPDKPGDTEEAAIRILKLRRRFHDIRLFRNIEHKWFRPYLADADDFQVRAALGCLMVIDHSEINEVITRLDAFTDFKKSKFTIMPNLPESVKKQVGNFYQYQRWQLRLPVHRIENHIQSPLYKTRIKL